MGELFISLCVLVLMTIIEIQDHQSMGLEGSTRPKDTGQQLVFEDPICTSYSLT